ncbi:XRE family transcriptional regulator [Gordonia sp. (in: high G+C Gram-positive bacteria)]|uniref:XRE family transcriptional regulator n=1 Tax=Gordonia sp. (in: high G+C Gram-positive bacteria) TaxID=84139 RepID=UPI00333E42FB
MFLLSLDEIARVKTINGLGSAASMEGASDVSERTWRTAFKTRKPTPAVLDALGNLGARPSRILVWEDPADTAMAAHRRAAMA